VRLSNNIGLSLLCVRLRVSIVCKLYDIVRIPYDIVSYCVLLC
jgi:hypothetical protein